MKSSSMHAIQQHLSATRKAIHRFVYFQNNMGQQTELQQASDLLVCICQSLYDLLHNKVKINVLLHIYIAAFYLPLYYCLITVGKLLTPKSLTKLTITNEANWKKKSITDYLHTVSLYGKYCVWFRQESMSRVRV